MAYLAIIILKMTRYVTKCQKHLVVVTCTALSLENGELDYNKSSVTNGEYPVDTMAYFMCNYGYATSGAHSTVCQTSGTWDEETPICIHGNKLINYYAFNTQGTPFKS